MAAILVAIAASLISSARARQALLLSQQQGTTSGWIIYVDADATGANDGSSWADSYNHLQDALRASAEGDEIRVAQGIYRPDQGAGIDAGERTAAFWLRCGVIIRGGYAGIGHPYPDTRSLARYESILSGDLNDDDVDVGDSADLLNQQQREENSYTVLFSNAADETTVLDGFTITGGNANGPWPLYNVGGGLSNWGSGPIIVNCTIVANSAEYGGGISNSQYSRPVLVNCNVANNSATEYGGGMHSWRSSPTVVNCTFAGNHAGNLAGAAYDSSGNTAAVNCIFWDNGPEQVLGSFNISYCNVQGDWPGEGNIYADPLFVDPVAADYHLLPGSPCIDSGNNAAVPSWLPVDLNGNARLVDDPCTHDTGYGTACMVDMGSCEFQGTLVVYVDADAVGANDGSSWADAYTCLQDALATAAYTGEHTEVRVATGVYTPDSSAMDPNGTGDRRATFQLVNRVTIKGGYAGCDAPDPDARDICIYETILSGDLEGNDACVADLRALSDHPSRSENSRHIVTGGNTDETAILDGFTVTGGNADDGGGGMYCSRGNPTVINCTFNRNTSPALGGGWLNEDKSNPAITDCTFSENVSQADGGGICNADSSPTIANCTFAGNVAVGNGGGMCNHGGGPAIGNCIFINNCAAGYGGGTAGPGEMANCTFCGNSAEQGGGVYGQSVLRNCIVWGNTLPEISGGSAVSYSNVRGGYPGEGNIDADPRFAFDYDFHLMPDSPCIDAGDNHALDGLTAADLDGNPRPLDGNNDEIAMADMGVYEYDPYAGIIALSSASVILSVPVGAAHSQEKTLLLGNAGGGILHLEFLEDCSWLSAVLTEGQVVPGAAEELTLVADTSGLGHGSYCCLLTVSDPQAANRMRTVTVTLNVTDILRVPEDFPTIQQAIDSSVDGDVVLIADGVYRGDGNKNLDLGSRAITVRSANGPANCTIECEHEGCGFSFHNGETGQSVLDGLTICNASAGGIRCERSSPTLVNCIFARNSGSGIHNDQAGPTIANCVFSGNHGAGISNHHSSHPGIINCTFSRNSADQGGGVCSDEQSSSTLTNCIVWGNTLPEISGSAAISCSNIRGGWPGQGNIDTDPFFMDADGVDDIPGTEDDNLQLPGGSPCIDAGDSQAVPQWLLTAMDGNPRVLDGIVDMGAYEAVTIIRIETLYVFVPEGGTAVLEVALAKDPLGSIDVHVGWQSGDPDITAQSGEVLSFDSSNYPRPQLVTLAAAEDVDPVNGQAIIYIHSPGCQPHIVLAREVDNDRARILFVDADAPGSNDGSDWANAFTNLQDALKAAVARPAIQEIWAAQGLYCPDQGLGSPLEDKRDATFRLINGVAVRGGFAGYGQLNPDARDADTFATILSGELADGEHCYSVVTGTGTDETAVLDGFTVTGGVADGEDDPDIIIHKNCGGGMFNGDYGCPTVANCVFTANSALAFGGGLYNGKGSNPAITDCTFADNAAHGDYHDGAGAGIYNREGSLTLTNCVFRGNDARCQGGALCNARYSVLVVINCAFEQNRTGSYGGGIHNHQESSLALTNCVFRSNDARHQGGGICNYNYSSTLTAVNCIFERNYAGRNGGGIYSSCSQTLANCTFSNNHSGDHGGAIANYYRGDQTIANCVFRGNKADDHGGGLFSYYGRTETILHCIFEGNRAARNGGAVYYGHSSRGMFKNCTFAGNIASNGDTLGCESNKNRYPNNVEMVNCIAWDTDSGIWNNDYSTISITYSNVAGGFSGEGNIDVDPMFTAPGYRDPNGTPQDTSDDYWASGDYHLLSQSGRWNPDRGAWVTDDITSPCIDAGDPNSDWLTELWPHGRRANMGAYGCTSEASMSLSGIGSIADLNNDGSVDTDDLLILSQKWLEKEAPLAEDLNRDGTVDFADYADLIRSWPYRE